jgi:hypothetical protein
MLAVAESQQAPRRLVAVIPPRVLRQHPRIGRVAVTRPCQLADDLVMQGRAGGRQIDASSAVRHGGYSRTATSSAEPASTAGAT